MIIEIITNSILVIVWLSLAFFTFRKVKENTKLLKLQNDRVRVISTAHLTQIKKEAIENEDYELANKCNELIENFGTVTITFEHY